VGGTAVVKRDPAISDITPDGTLQATADCDRTSRLVHAADHRPEPFRARAGGVQVGPDYLWQAELVYGWFNAPSERGVF
jgi:hypothetical protein